MTDKEIIYYYKKYAIKKVHEVSLSVLVVVVSTVLLSSSIIISSGSGARAKNSSPFEYIC
jgi:hypothetical protein